MGFDSRGGDGLHSGAVGVGALHYRLGDSVAADCSATADISKSPIGRASRAQVCSGLRFTICASTPEKPRLRRARRRSSARRFRFCRFSARACFWASKSTIACGAAAPWLWRAWPLIAWGEESGLGFGAGAFLVMGAAVCAALYNTLQKPLLARYAALDVTSAAIFCGTLLLVPLGGGLVEAVKAAPLIPTLNLLLLGAFPGALGYVLWMWCLAQMPVARLMNYLYLVAPLSVLMGWLFLHELPSQSIARRRRNYTRGRGLFGAQKAGFSCQFVVASPDASPQFHTVRRRVWRRYYELTTKSCFSENLENNAKLEHTILR